jgi:hypothetical protein
MHRPTTLDPTLRARIDGLPRTTDAEATEMTFTSFTVAEVCCLAPARAHA